MSKRFFIALLLLFLLSTYNHQRQNSFNFKFNIDEIFIENNSIIKEDEIKKKISFLYETNLFLLNIKTLEVKIKEFEFIDSFEIKKIYPNKIRIRVFEKKPIAILQKKKEKKYYTNNGSLITFTNYKVFQNLPTIFGDEKSFKILHDDLKKIEFPIDEIKTFYFFESKRWDLITTNNQTIKLPSKDYKDSLKHFLNLKDQVNFEKYKIFDYRIKDQLILK